MGFNKKVLSKAVSELGKAKAPGKPKDITVDPRGYWNPANQGQPVRVSGGDYINGMDITMHQVSHPIWAQPNVGPGAIMYPEENRHFPSADYVDETPIAKKGGTLQSKKYSKSMSATNKLFAKNKLFQNKKSKIFDPNAKFKSGGSKLGPINLNPNPLSHYELNYGFNLPVKQDGGESDYEELELTPKEIQAYRDGGYVVEELPEAQDGGPQNTAGPRQYIDEYEEEQVYPQFTDEYMKERYKVEQSNKKAQDFNKAYAESENYKRLLEKQGYTPEEIKNRINSTVGISNFKYTDNGPSWVGNDSETGNDFITYNVMDPGDWPGYDQIAGHEWGHVGVNSEESPLKKSEQDAFINRLKLEDVNKNQEDAEHDKNPQENRADLLQLRQQLQESGLFDSTKPEEFTEKHLEKYKKLKNSSEDNYNKLHNRMFRLYDDKDIIWFMNNIAQNTNKQKDYLQPNQIKAQKGGYVQHELVKAQKGLEQSDSDVYTYAGRPGSYYKKDDKGQWFISNKGTGNKFIPIKDPKGTRAKVLNEQAKKNVPMADSPYALAASNFANNKGTDSKQAYIDKYQNSPELAKQKVTRQFKTDKELAKTEALINSGKLENPTNTNQPIDPRLTGPASDNTRMISGFNGQQAFESGLRYNSPESVEERKRQADWKKQKWDEYNKMSLYDKVLDRTQAFAAHPLLMTANVLAGDQGYIPGMGRGLLNKDDPEYDRYLQATGQQKGAFEVNDFFNMINPTYWAANAGNEFSKGNYVQGTAELGLGLLGLGQSKNLLQGSKYLIDDVAKGANYAGKTFKAAPNAKNILGDYRNIEELRLANHYKDFNAASKAHPTIFNDKKVFDATRTEAKELLKKYKKDFTENFGAGKDDEVLLYGAHNDLKNSVKNKNFLAEDEFAKSAGLKNDLTNQEKFLADAYQLEYSPYFNRNVGAGRNQKFSEYLANDFNSLVNKNKTARPVQVSRVSNFDRPVKTLRKGASEPELVHYNDLKEGDVIYPEHNWSTTTDLESNVWGSGNPSAKTARINVPENQGVFRPNMYKGTQYANEQELVLPSGLGYRVSGVNPQGFTHENPRFMFDAVNPSVGTSGTLNAGISPQLIKNAVGPSNKVAASILNHAYLDPFFNKTLNKISPLNFIPGYGSKLTGAVKPLGNVINRSIKDGNLVESKNLLQQAKGLLKKTDDADLTTKMNKSNTNIYSAKIDGSVQGSNVGLGTANKQGVLGRTFNKSNAVYPLQTKTGNTLNKVPLSDPGVSLHRRLPFSNRYVPIDKQKLLNNKFQWSTTGAGLQNVGEKFVKALPTYGLIGGAGAAALYNPYDYMPAESAEFIKENNIPLEDITDLPTRTDAFKEGFKSSLISPTQFLAEPDPHGVRFYGSLLGYSQGGNVINEEWEDELDDYTIELLRKAGYVVKEID